MFYSVQICIILSIICFGILFCLFYTVLLSRNAQKDYIPVYTILPVRNSEETIENTIRSIAYRMLSAPSSQSFPPIDLIVLDLDSSDNTFVIAQKLATEYPFIHPMHRTEYNDFINSL